MKYKSIFSIVLILIALLVIKVNFFNCKNYDKTLFNKNELFFSSNVDIQGELNDKIDNQLKDIDFDSLNTLLDNLTDEGKSLINDKSFYSLVKDFINGKTNINENFLLILFKVIFNDLLNYLPFFTLIISISVVYSLLGQFANEKNKSLTSLVNIVCFSSVATIVIKLILDVINNVSSVIVTIEGQMEVVFPLLLTLINALGSVVTASSFQPILAVLSVGITKLFTLVLIPIFISSVVFRIVGNISKNVKLEKFSKFFTSLFGWIIGIVFTIFIAFLTIQGLTVSSIDSISLKTAKYAIKSYVPILGSYLSDGVSLILASSILIKNAIGATGLLLIFATIFIPIIKIIVLMLLLKLVSAILESISDEKISNFLFGISKSLNMLNVCLLAIGFMFLISISLLMSCSNII